MTRKKGQEERATVVEDWIARDLTAAVQADELQPAFEVEPLIEQVCAVLSSGKHPLLLGEAGVGKTAVLHELLRQHRDGRKIPRLDGCRVVQVSLRKLKTGVTHSKPLSDLLEPLLEAALESRPPLVLHVTDFHEAMDGASTLFERFLLRSTTPFLAEGERSACQTAFECLPELREHFVPIYVDEPDLGTMERLLPSWSAEQARRGAGRYTPGACDHALYLAQRFLTRTRLPRSALDLLSQTASLAGADRVVDHAAVIERFCATQRVRRELVDPALALDLDALVASFASAVLGQPDAVKAIVAMVGALKAGLSDERRALGVFLFVGPTGVGKTHLAQALASYMFGGRERMIRINMADFQGERAAGELFGDRSGYSDARGILTRRMAGQPFGVVLLDEFEKATEPVRDRFLQLFDEGLFINAAGESIACRSMVFIATSNAGAEVFRGQPFGFFTRTHETRTRALELERALDRFFRFELLNRFDAVVHFFPLSRHDIRAIGLREIQLLQARAGLRQRNLQLEVDESVLDWLAANGYDPDFGARFLRRTVERSVTAALAEVLVREAPAAGGTVSLYVRANRIAARILAPQRRPAPRSKVALPAAPGEARRVLDEAGLRGEAQRILQTSAGLLRRLDEERQEYSALLERMNESAFWSDPSEQPVVLARFRELDVAIRMQERLAEPLQRLGALSAADAPALEALAECLGQAVASLREWELRLDHEGPDAAWLVLSNVDPLHPASEWLTQLVEMELAWCQRGLHLSAAVVAYEAAEGALRRVVVEVEGPGALAQLEPERGLHRFHRSQGRDPRVRVELFARGSAPAGAWPHLGPAPRRAPRHFGLTPRCSARLELARRGAVLELLAENEELLHHLVNDLRGPWDAPPSEPDAVARHYNEDGCGARDARTGATAVHLKDVLRGGLDPFLDAWRRARLAASAVAAAERVDGRA